jgi:hypothetical protein
MPVAVPPFTGLRGNGGADGDDARDDTGVRVLGRPGRAGEVDVQAEDGPDLVRVITAPRHPHLLWVHEHLQHLSSHAQVISDPASHVAEQRRLPWWR